MNIEPAMQTVLLVWLAIALERLIPISTSIDPLSFFRFICQRMAKKVLNTAYAGQQAIISGSLALTLLLLPPVIIIYLVREFAGYQWLLDILLLWVLLQYNGQVKLIASSMRALSQNKKQLAKDLLQTTVLRKTQSLSALGVIKAGLESMFLRYNHQYICVIFWYLIAGPVAALAYRLCYEASQIWSVKLTAFADFGKLAYLLTYACRSLPSLITSITFILLTQPNKVVKCMLNRQFWRHALFQHRLLLLQALACSLKITASGPVMYEANKMRFPRFYAHMNANTTGVNNNTSLEPNQSHIKMLIRQSNKHLIVLLLLVTWIYYFNG